MDRLSARTRDTYQRNAAGFDARRNKALFEKAWLDRALQHVPRGGAVLDLGCGAGEPIGRYLSGRGVALTGADFAPAMLAIYASRLPDAEIVESDMRWLNLPTRFDAIIGWGSFFHLSMAQQRTTLPRLLRHLAPGGQLLLTIGPEAGEATGHVQGEEVFHASLSGAEYKAILWISGAELVDYSRRDPDCDYHSLLLARRSP